MSEQINETDVFHLVQELDVSEPSMDEAEEALAELNRMFVTERTLEPEQSVPALAPLAVVPLLSRAEALTEVALLDDELAALSKLRQEAEDEHEDALAALRRQRDELETSHGARLTELEERIAERSRARAIHLRDHELAPVAWRVAPEVVWSPLRCRCSEGHGSSGLVLCGGQLVMVVEAPGWIRDLFEAHRGRCIAIAGSTGERCQAKAAVLRCPQHRETAEVVVTPPVAWADVSSTEIVGMPADPSQPMLGEDEEVTL